MCWQWETRLNKWNYFLIVSASSCVRPQCDKISACEPVAAHLLGWAPSFGLKLIVCTIRRTASHCNYHAAYQKGYETMRLWVRRLDILSQCQMPVWGAMWERALLCQTDMTGGKYYNQTKVIWILVIKFISLAKIFHTVIGNNTNTQARTHTQSQWENWH